jgi:hypothetical protein
VIVNRGILVKIKAVLGSIATAAAIAVASVLPADAAQAATAVPCQATATVAHPSTNQTEPVYIATLTNARVEGVAHYKTTKTTKVGTTNVRGHLYLDWRISHATPGYRVIVTLSVVKGNVHGTCSTSFVPVK